MKKIGVPVVPLEVKKCGLVPFTMFSLKRPTVGAFMVRYLEYRTKQQ